MLQRELPEFVSELLESGFTVLIETSGSRDLAAIPEQAIRIVDIKTPGALQKEGYDGGEPSEGFLATHFHYPILEQLQPHDEIKFVVTSRADFDWSVSFLNTHGLQEKVSEVLISPSHGQVDPADLVEWMKESEVPARLNLQLHKLIWGEETRGV